MMKKYELELSDENIKETLEKDVLSRNKKLVILAKILLNQKENIIISIDGNWGCGKTFFIKQFEYILKKIETFKDNTIFCEEDKNVFKKLSNDNLIVYYNAWENDDHDNPLESMMFSILNEFPQQKSQLISFDEYRKLIVSFFNDIVKAASMETIDLKHFSEMKSYEDMTKSVMTIEEKKSVFNKLIDNILTKNQRLILIIDELDRCKPSFAVKILETIKHFYFNHKITIIVATNNSELSHTIRNYYGNGFDGYGYLNKFYDAIISLDSHNLKKYLQNQLNFCNKTWMPHDFSYVILKHYNFSLRECNKFITIYNLLKNYIENESTFDKYKNYIFNDLFLPLAVALKIKNIDLYQSFMNNKGENIILELLKSFEKKNIKHWVHEIVLKANNNDISDERKIINYYNEIFGDNEFSFNFYEAVSLLGSKINLNNE